MLKMPNLGGLLWKGWKEVKGFERGVSFFPSYGENCADLKLNYRIVTPEKFADLQFADQT